MSRAGPCTVFSNHITMFLLPVRLRVGDQFGEILSRWGLDGRAQARALARPENAVLHRIMGSAPLHPRQRVPQPVGRPLPLLHLHVPIDVQLQVTRYLTRVDLVHGLSPRVTGASGPPVHTHGMDVRIERNLLDGSGLRWIQTTTRLHDHTHGSRLTEFVDGALNTGEPWVFPRGRQVEFTDLPSAPGRQGNAPGTDFEATATLAVLLEARIILAAGITWGFNVTGNGSGDVSPKAHRAATAVDFAKQLRILKRGRNVVGDPTGSDLAYELAP
jgi:hypothetical protein